MPIPSNLHGSAIKLLSSSDILKSLNKAGINFCLITLSKGNTKFSMFSIVLLPEDEYLRLKIILLFFHTTEGSKMKYNFN